MHLLAAQAGAIQQDGEAIDLGQTPGDIVFASSADSELAQLAGAADRAGYDGLRLANLLRWAAAAHPRAGCARHALQHDGGGRHHQDPQREQQAAAGRAAQQ